MTPELLYFFLRAALALGLYAFLGAVVYVMWRDVRTAAETASARQRRLGRLVTLVETGLNGGERPGPKTHPVLPVTSLGRAPTNTATLLDDTVSLEHALLTHRAGQWWLEDLGSRNGTSVNGAPIDQPVVVTAGDVIGIGHVRLKLELD